MNFILFDHNRSNLLPYTYTRPTAEIRIGILTIREKWEKWLKASCSFKTEDYLAVKFPLKTGNENVWINGGVCPNDKLVKEIKKLKPGESIVINETTIAFNSGNKTEISPKTFTQIISNSSPLIINNPWDIFSNNGRAIDEDFALLTKGRKSQPISKTNQVLGRKNIFLEKGAKVECSILNATTGKIYIGKDAEIMEGSVVRGSLALCEHSALKLSTKIYGPTTVGPYSKVGGEINNSVIFAFSNKAHDGFLGNSVIGEWCNIGADSNNSNLKNNYAPVKLWNYDTERFVNTELTFCGLFMGDHSKCGINTMFNTGTVVGVNANIFGSGFPRNFIPDFAWGGAQGFSTYKLKDAFEVASRVYERRGKVFDEIEKNILSHLFDITERYRNF